MTKKKKKERECERDREKGNVNLMIVSFIIPVLPTIQTTSYVCLSLQPLYIA